MENLSLHDIFSGFYNSFGEEQQQYQDLINDIIKMDNCLDYLLQEIGNNDPNSCSSYIYFIFAMIQMKIRTFNQQCDDNVVRNLISALSAFIVNYAKYSQVLYYQECLKCVSLLVLIAVNYEEAMNYVMNCINDTEVMFQFLILVWESTEQVPYFQSNQSNDCFNFFYELTINILIQYDFSLHWLCLLKNAAIHVKYFEDLIRFFPKAMVFENDIDIIKQEIDFVQNLFIFEPNPDDPTYHIHALEYSFEFSKYLRSLYEQDDNIEYLLYLSLIWDYIFYIQDEDTFFLKPAYSSIMDSIQEEFFNNTGPLLLSVDDPEWNRWSHLLDSLIYFCDSFDNCPDSPYIRIIQQVLDYAVYLYDHDFEKCEGSATSSNCLNHFIETAHDVVIEWLDQKINAPSYGLYYLLKEVTRETNLVKGQNYPQEIIFPFLEAAVNLEDPPLSCLRFYFNIFYDIPKIGTILTDIGVIQQILIQCLNIFSSEASSLVCCTVNIIMNIYHDRIPISIHQELVQFIAPKIREEPLLVVQNFAAICCSLIYIPEEQTIEYLNAFLEVLDAFFRIIIVNNNLIPQALRHFIFIIRNIRITLSKLYPKFQLYISFYLTLFQHILQITNDQILYLPIPLVQLELVNFINFGYLLGWDLDNNIIFNWLINISDTAFTAYHAKLIPMILEFFPNEIISQAFSNVEIPDDEETKKIIIGTLNDIVNKHGDKIWDIIDSSFIEKLIMTQHSEICIEKMSEFILKIYQCCTQIPEDLPYRIHDGLLSIAHNGRYASLQQKIISFYTNLKEKIELPDLIIE